MTYFIDTEFIDDGETIDLISIGIVSSDGREYYAQSGECNLTKASDWVWENVLPHLTMCYGNSHYQAKTITESHAVHAYGKCDLYTMHNLPDECAWRTRKQIAQEIYAFMDVEKYGKPEWYGWCASYDFVALCQLFGTMMDLPTGYPHYIRDLQHVLDSYSMSDEKIPKQDGSVHNALSDARYTKRFWQWVEGYLYGRGLSKTRQFPFALA
jgi:3' exoribonuclease, RNase T-like